jgi:hypothetical protein
VTISDPVQEQIAALNDEQAIQVLELVVEDAQLPTPDAAEWHSIQSHLGEAITASHLDLYQPNPDTTYSEGDLARAALTYHAESSPDATKTVQQAIQYASSAGERFDPVTLAVGALAIAVMQTEVKLKRDTHGKWSFELHKKAMRDSTLGQVISTFVGHFLPRGK